MEDLIIGTMFIVTVICYTVYKIDCNHVKNPKNNDYPTGGLRKQAEHKPESNRPSEETMKKLFGKIINQRLVGYQLNQKKHRYHRERTVSE